MIDRTKCKIPEKFANHPLFNEFHRGMNFGFMSKRGYYSRPEVRKQPEFMAKSGVNWVTLNANFCQETYASRKVFLDFIFSSGEFELTEMARIMHDNGLRILLKPCLTPLDGAWMGAVNFPETPQIQGVSSNYWKEWFDSFIESSKYYAEFAERNHIEALIIGAEYFGTEYRNDDWRRSIAAIRQIYSGPITYEFTCKSKNAYDLEWFEDLDFLALSFYPPASSGSQNGSTFRNAPHVFLEQMIECLKPNKDTILDICRRFGNKPIAFTEIGTRSAHGCIALPWDFQADTFYDGEEQANYMEAVFHTFQDLPTWLGLYWWKWDETQNRPQYHGDPGGDRGFTVQGKPAEEVLRKWFAAK